MGWKDILDMTMASTHDHQSSVPQHTESTSPAGTELRLVYCRGPRGLTMRWVVVDSYQDAADPEVSACPIVFLEDRQDAARLAGSVPAPLAAD